MLVLNCPVCTKCWVLLNTLNVLCVCGAPLQVNFAACGNPYFKVIQESGTARGPNSEIFEK